MLEKVNLQLLPVKYEFSRPRVKCVSYVLSSDGVSPSADKLKAVQEYPVPRSAKDVRVYLCLA